MELLFPMLSLLISTPEKFFVLKETTQKVTPPEKEYYILHTTSMCRGLLSMVWVLYIS